MTDYIAHNPAYSLASELTTFNDVVESLLDLGGMERSERNERSAIRAVLEAYRDLPNKREWNAFKTRIPFATVAPISAGTASYDHAGNVAGERVVTFSTGVLPDDVDLYSLQLDSVHYEVAQRIDDTTLQLTERSNPGADVAATTYQLYRDCYIFPLDFQSGGQLLDISNRNAPIDYVSPDDALWLARGCSAQQPTAYTFRGVPRRQGVLGLYFSPIPSGVRNYELVYNRRPRPLRTQSYATGTASVSGGSRTVTITGAALSPKHVGCVMRFGTASDAPLPLQKGLSDGTEALLERVVVEVTSSTELLLDVAADAAFSGVKYTLSSVVDLNPGPMLTYFTLLAEACFARNEGRKDAEAREFKAKRFLMEEAAAADLASVAAKQRRYMPMSLADIATSVTP